MLRLAILFIALALVAALFGYGLILGYSWKGARLLFFIFAVLAVLSVAGGVYRRRAFLN